MVWVWMMRTANWNWQFAQRTQFLGSICSVCTQFMRFWTISLVCDELKMNICAYIRCILVFPTKYHYALLHFICFVVLNQWSCSMICVDLLFAFECTNWIIVQFTNLNSNEDSVYICNKMIYFRHIHRWLILLLTFMNAIHALVWLWYQI